MKRMALLCLILASICTFAQAKETTIGRWTVEENISPIDDSVNLMAVSVSDGSILAVKCEAGEPMIAISSKLYFGLRQGYAKVIVRFGKADSYTTEWLILRSGILILRDEENKEFMRQMLDHETLAVQMTGYSRVQTTVFQLKGSRQAFAKILQACPAFIN